MKKSVISPTLSEEGKSAKLAKGFNIGLVQ